MNTNKQSNRLLALDVMRGITMAGMILVNTPGEWGHIFAPLRHAMEWAYSYRSVFPFFMFMMGVSMSFSFDKYGRRLTMPFFMKLVKRAVVLFLLGMFISFYSLMLNRIVNYNPEQSLVTWSDIRILGVLQRFAITYFLGSLLVIWITRRRTLLVACTFILVLYHVILTLGNGYDLTENNIIAVIDNSLWGPSHMYTSWLPDGNTIKFDPEGLLSALPGIAHVALGYVGGEIIRTKKSIAEKMTNLSIMGIVLLFGGYMLSYGCPINKSVWSSTYVLASCGSALLFIVLLIWIIDVRRCRGWITPFQAFGMNPLFIYLLSELLEITLSYCGIHDVIYDAICYVIPLAYFSSLTYGLLFVSFCGLIAYRLFKRKRKIIIKI